MNKPTYEQFAEQYAARDTTSEQREIMRNKYPKLAAKSHLLSNPGALHEDSTVYLIVRKRSRTGLSKSISLYAFAIRTDPGYHASPENPQLQALTLTHNVAKLLGYTVHESDGFDVLRTDDYPQEFVAHLSQTLFGIDKPSALRCEVL